MDNVSSTDEGDKEVNRAIEAILISADEPIPTTLLAQVLERPLGEVEQRVAQLGAGYEVDGRGYILQNVAGGWRFATHPDLSEYVEKFVVEGRSARLSAAAMETLAIVAYKQPISRAQIASIRGVGVDSVMRSLEQREYICEIGRDPGPGQAVLFGTTSKFLEKLGLNDVEDLPALSEFVPSQDIVDSLDQGLRPEGEDLPRSTARTRPNGQNGEVGDLEEVSSDSSDPELDIDSDPLERLEETTARLDSLVETVKNKLASVEAAIAPAETDEADVAGREPEGDAESEEPSL